MKRFYDPGTPGTEQAGGDVQSAEVPTAATVDNEEKLAGAEPTAEAAPTAELA